jgi:hypothetical protein
MEQVTAAMGDTPGFFQLYAPKGRTGPKAAGVTHVLRRSLAEADLLMAVDGYPTIEGLKVAGLVRVD